MPPTWSIGCTFVPKNNGVGAAPHQSPPGPTAPSVETVHANQGRCGAVQRKGAVSAVPHGNKLFQKFHYFCWPIKKRMEPIMRPLAGVTAPHNNRFTIHNRRQHGIHSTCSESGVRGRREDGTVVRGRLNVGFGQAMRGRLVLCAE